MPGVCFEHPVTQEQLVFTQNVPNDFKHILDKLGAL